MSRAAFLLLLLLLAAAAYALTVQEVGPAACVDVIGGGTACVPPVFNAAVYAVFGVKEVTSPSGMKMYITAHVYHVNKSAYLSKLPIRPDGRPPIFFNKAAVDKIVIEKVKGFNLYMGFGNFSAAQTWSACGGTWTLYDATKATAIEVYGELYAVDVSTCTAYLVATPEIKKWSYSKYLVVIPDLRDEFADYFSFFIFHTAMRGFATQPHRHAAMGSVYSGTYNLEQNKTDVEMYFTTFPLVSFGFVALVESDRFGSYIGTMTVPFFVSTVPIFASGN
jgi:hypothetical protein